MSNTFKMPQPTARVFEHGATVRLDWYGVRAAHNAKTGPLYTAESLREVVDQFTLSQYQIEDAYRSITNIPNLNFATCRQEFGEAILAAAIRAMKEQIR